MMSTTLFISNQLNHWMFWLFCSNLSQVDVQTYILVFLNIFVSMNVEPQVTISWTGHQCNSYKLSEFKHKVPLSL